MAKHYLIIENESGDRWTAGYWNEPLDRNQIAQYLWDNCRGDFEEVDGKMHSFVRAKQCSFEEQEPVKLSGNVPTEIKWI
jgi:hypothetical protein